MSVTKERPKFLESLEPIAVDVIRPAAIAIDEGGMFPRQAMEALFGLGPVAGRVQWRGDRAFHSSRRGRAQDVEQ